MSSTINLLLSRAHHLHPSHALYHAQTLWLFTRSDLKTIVIPSTLFALAYAFSCIEPLNPFTPSLLATTLTITLRLPQTIFWIWLNLLPFTISNQRRASSIAEDSINKPWRVFPTKRLAQSHADWLIALGYTLAVLWSWFLGGLAQSIALIALGGLYNDRGGADKSCAVRNLLNAAGYVSFVSGALEVMLQQRFTAWKDVTHIWLAVLGAVVMTTIHAADMADQDGDRLQARRTVPLVVGDVAARWALAVVIVAWSCFCPIFWEVPISGFFVPMGLGAVVGGRFLKWRNVRADKKSFLLYNVWFVALCCLPLQSTL